MSVFVCVNIEKDLGVKEQILFVLCLTHCEVLKIFNREKM